MNILYFRITYVYQPYTNNSRMLEILTNCADISISYSQLNDKYNKFITSFHAYMCTKCSRGKNNVAYDLINLIDEYKKIHKMIIDSNKTDAQINLNKTKIELNLKVLNLIKILLTESVSEKNNILNNICFDDNMEQNKKSSEETTTELSEEEKLIDKMIETEKNNLRIMKKKKILSELILEKEKEEKDINVTLLEALNSDKKKQIDFVSVISNKIIVEEEMRNKLVVQNEQV